MSSVMHSATLQRVGHSGPVATLQYTGMTEHQDKIFTVFETAIKGLKEYTEANPLLQAKYDDILRDIKQVPITVNASAEHGNKKLILTMMAAFNILKKAQGNQIEFNQALVSIKAGWFYFTPENNNYEKQDFRVELYSQTAPSPTQEKTKYETTIDKKTTDQLYAKLEAFNLAGPNVLAVQDFDFNGFKDFVGSYVSQTSLDPAKKDQFQTYLDKLKIHAPQAKDEIDVLKSKTTPQEVVEELKAVARKLGGDTSGSDSQADLQAKAKAIIAFIQDKITAAINAQLGQS